MVSRTEFQLLEKRLHRAEQGIRQQQAFVKSLQARVDSLTGESLGPGRQPANSTLYDNSRRIKGYRDRSRSPRLPFRSRYSQPALPQPPKELYGTEDTTVEEFARQNRLDAKCVEALTSQSEEVQQYVMNQGPADGRNPSAMVMSRIAKCNSEYASSAFVPPASVGDEVEDFIAMHELDEKCGETLRQQSTDCQVAVLSQGAPEGRNSSAMVMGRISKFVRGEY